MKAPDFPGGPPNDVEVARYFPVETGSFRLRAGLRRFGTDFGNGDADQRFFSRDAELPRLLRDKAQILDQHPERFQILADQHANAALVSIRNWMSATLENEWGAPVDAAGGFAALGASIAEDFVVTQREAGGSDRVLLVHVCFPSGWRPERLLGRSFANIHAPIPEASDLLARASSLVSAMVERGPYVRFVWSVSAEAPLDHHPDTGNFGVWSERTRPGYLRVERQVTVPFPACGASLFLIRPYHYAFTQLTRAQRSLLVASLSSMSPAMLAYKRLTDALPHVLSSLESTR